uniref:Uncharacterized protein n=1 Tax=Ciona savignyi TaxID=51511 RepID=H2Y6E1_CIOSA
MSETTKEEFNSKIQTLENEVKLKAEEATRCQGDLDRLLGILKETENEKHLKDKKIATFEKRCKEQATKIKSMQNEMIQDAQRKQEALLAAISEKDSNIALLELSQSRKKTNAEEVCLLRREKDSLVQQLKQQTQNRLKLMQQNFDSDPDSNNDGKVKEADAEGIWA